MALWFLHKTNRITDQITIDEGQTVVSDDEDGSEADIGNATNLDSISYPPESVQSALNMLNYMKAEKTIPFPAPEWFRSVDHKELPVALKPTEEYCRDCREKLSRPYRITHRARILTLQGFVEGVETFFKVCRPCDNYYRYQEFENGSTISMILFCSV